ncbi:MAG: hypothetical protein AB1488_03600 [Nitrospirota bacterium]
MQDKRIITVICIAFLIINIIAPVIYQIHNNGAMDKVIFDNPAGLVVLLSLNICEKPADSIVSPDNTMMLLMPANPSIQMFINCTYLTGTAYTPINEAGLSAIEKPPRYSA